MRSHIDRSIRWLMSCSLSLLLSSCGGGGGDGADVTPPTVVSTFPTDGAFNVEPDVVLNVDFSEDLLTTSITSNSVTLTDNVSVPATLDFDGFTQIVLTPDQPLSLLTAYQATADENIADLSGNILGTHHQWNFSTRDGVWQTAQAIENLPNSASFPALHIDAKGNLTVVWCQFDGTRNNLWGNRYEPENGWATPQLLETNNAADISFFKLSGNESGEVFVIWRQGDGSANYNAWVNHYQPGIGWDGAKTIQNPVEDPFNPSIAVDNTGNAIAIWVQYDSGQNNVWANRYVNGAGWGTPELIETNNTGTALETGIDTDDAGNAIAIWSFQIGSQYQLWSNRYENGVGWGNPTLLRNLANSLTGPIIEVGAGSDAAVVWKEGSGNLDLYTSYYSARTSSWSAPQLAESNTETVWRLDAQFDNSSNSVLLLWNQDDGMSNNGIWFNRYNPRTGWAGAELIGSSSEFVNDPAITSDGNGNALAMWIHNDEVWYNRYTAGTGWGGQSLLFTGNSNDQVVVEANKFGYAAAAWLSGATFSENVYLSLFE